MARSHKMTPARRAALRKAQLVSARKRRKSGFRSSASKSVKQGVQRTRASAALAANNPRKRRKVIKRAAVVAAVAGVGAAALAGSRTETYQVHKGVRKSMRKKNFNGAHPRGSERKAFKKAAKARYKKRVTPIIRHNVRRKKARRK